MPPAYNAQQRNAIAQFASFTSQRDSVAAKYLKQHGWNVEAAIDSFFQTSTKSSNTNSGSETALRKLFEKYKDDPSNNDSIGVEGTMKYLGDVKVNLDEAAMLAVFELCQSPTQGEITREGFVNGWKSLNCDTIAKQAEYIDRNVRKKIPFDPEFLRRTYRYAFNLARQSPAQKVLPAEIAVEYWRILLSPDHGGFDWSGNSTPWLNYWLEFVENEYQRGINRDLWDQLLVFAMKTLEQEDLGFWREDAAWPGAIDDFVLFMNRKHLATNDTEMEED